MKNLGLIYNKTCYEKYRDPKDDKFLEESLLAIRESRFSNAKDLHCSGLEELPSFRSFQMETIYPGLTAGLGYAHGVASEKDSKLGFSFDYVTGQPYLPGSTVKGMLRSCFAYPDLVRDSFGMSDLDVQMLEAAIFDDSADVFLDSVIARGDRHDRIMDEDHITPHASPIKDPVPIKFFKVVPGVVFEFRFLLTDTELNGAVISSEMKVKAFQALLKITGIGAKTNVGYGGLQEVTKRDVRGAEEKNGEPQTQDASEQGPFVEGQMYQGVVTNINDNYIYLRVNGETKCSIYIRLHWVGDRSELVRGNTLRVTYLECKNGWYCFSRKGRN